MQRSEDPNGCDRGQRQLRRHVGCDGEKTNDIDVELLAGGFDPIKIVARVVSQAEIERVSGDALLYDVSVPIELGADGSPNEIRPVRIEPFTHHQVDLAKINESKIDGNFFRIGAPRHLDDVFQHSFALPLTIRLDGTWVCAG
jgi:hypothetical protein